MRLVGGQQHRAAAAQLFFESNRPPQAVISQGGVRGLVQEFQAHNTGGARLSEGVINSAVRTHLSANPGTVPTNIPYGSSADALHASEQALQRYLGWADAPVGQVDAFNGLVLGALLALISSGLTIIYGTLGVLNLAHGAMFMLGGYAGWVAFTYTGSFLVAVLAGSLFVALVGIVMERLIIRHFYTRPHEDQLLVTFGLGIVFVELVRFGFGSLSKSVPPPAPLMGITNLGFMVYPTYRLALLGIITVALLALYFVLYRTRIGMIVRAGIEDSVMVDSLGINVYKIFMLVFGIGAMAAGFAGIVNAPVVSIAPDVGEAILVQTFVVVVYCLAVEMDL